MSDNIIHVRISEFRVASPPAVLKITGLGSCVALALYDPELKLGGLAHVLLPGPAPVNRALNAGPLVNPYKYADQALAALLRSLEESGSSLHRLRAKMAGGANMFSEPAGMDAEPQKQSVGERNVEAVRKLLSGLSIPILGEAVGGKLGRTIIFDVSTGDLVISGARGQSNIL